MMELNEYLNVFIDESKEHLQSMNDNMLQLEQNPQDITIIQSMFRSAHTLKGMSATMGFEDLASLTHEMENVLDLVRNHKLEMSPIVFDCIFKSIDSLEMMVNDIIQGGTGKADVTSIVSQLKAIVKGEVPGSTAPAGNGMDHASGSAGIDEYQYSVLKQSLESGYRVYYVEVTVQKQCVLKAARAYMVFDVLEQNGEVVKAIPSVEEIEQEKFDQIFKVYYITGIESADLQQKISNISEIESVKVVNLDTEKLLQLSKFSSSPQQPGKLQAQHTGQSDIVGPAEQAAAVQQKSSQASAPVANRTIRVDSSRLDVLMNLFSEMLIDRVRLEQLASEIRRSDLTETIEHMARISSDLQNIVMKLRMVQIDTVFNRFPRMIRDLAKSLNKKVDLIITGADTELDRTVIDEIGDPLVHLLRNAIDHGVETVEERIAAGKPETGIIHLRAYHSGNQVMIEIEEDGRGINREKVLKTAIKNGIVTQDQANKMRDEEVHQLLFASGFSTADKISDISGRGVGLDVVKSKIQSLGGHVVVESKLGRGTKFAIQMPLTLSIISAMLVRLGSEKYALPLSSIVETASITKETVRVVHGNKMIDFRRNVIPLVSLSKLFEVTGSQEEKLEEWPIIIIRKGDKLAALVVDELIGQQEIVLKTLGKYLNSSFAISGATILGDGQVALIIDTNALIK